MDDLLELLAFHRWACLRTFESLRELSDEQLQRDLGSSFKSIFETLVHSFGAERAWLGRLEGLAPVRASPADYPDLQTLLAEWEALLERWPEVVRRLGDPKLEIAYKTFAGDPNSNRLDQIVKHLVNHATYHRGQVVAMQRMMGSKAVSTDLLVYYQLHKSL